MNPSKKSVCIAIGLAGAVLLGGAVAVLIMKFRKGKRNCSLFSCNHTEGQAAETDIIYQASPMSEVNYDAN